MPSKRKKHSWLSPIVVACCKSNDTQPRPGGTGFWSRVRRGKLTLYLELKFYLIVQVDKGRNYYPTRISFHPSLLFSEKPRKSTSWDLTFSPEAAPWQAKSSQTHPPLPVVLERTQWGFLLSLLASHSPFARIFGGECLPTTLVAVTTSYFSSRNFRQSLVLTLL